MTIEEIQELLADFENRISYLENLATGHIAQKTEMPAQKIELSRSQMNIVNQLKAQVTHLQNKMNEHIDYSRRNRDRL